jgi:hypothetical protein
LAEQIRAHVHVGSHVPLVRGGAAVTSPLCDNCNVAPAGARRQTTWESYEDCLECSRLGWIAHPRCEHPGEVEKFLIEHREDVEIIAQISDDDASYSYDDYAVIRVLITGRSARESFYLLNTSGCSCPDSRETWSVLRGPTNLGVIEAVALDDTYRVPFNQREAFLAAIKAGMGEPMKAVAG